MRRSLVVALAVTVLNPASAAASGDPNPKAEAQIALTFGADSTSFTAVSSKDISNVVIQFGDGTVVKDEIDEHAAVRLRGIGRDHLGRREVRSHRADVRVRGRRTGPGPGLAPMALLELLA